MTLQLDGVSLVRLMGSSRPAFVLASTTGCTQCDGPLGGAWEQLATLTRDQLREPGAVWRLSCDEQPMLCDVLPAVAAATPGDPLFMEWSQGDMIWRRYSGELSTQGLVMWVRDTLSSYNRLPAEKRQPQQRSPSGLVTVGFDGVVSSMPPPTPPPWPLSPPSPLGQSRLPLGIEHTPHEYVPHDDDVGAPLAGDRRRGQSGLRPQHRGLRGAGGQPGPGALDARHSVAALGARPQGLTGAASCRGSGSFTVDDDSSIPTVLLVMCVLLSSLVCGVVFMGIDDTVTVDQSA